MPLSNNNARGESPRLQELPAELAKSLEREKEQAKGADSQQKPFEWRPASDSPVTSTHGTPMTRSVRGSIAHRESGSRDDGTSTPSPITSNVYINTGSGIHTVETTPESSHFMGDTPPRVSSSSTDAGGPRSLYKKKKNPTTLDIPGLTKSKSSPNGLISQKDQGSKLVIIMVGIPATGKSFITKKLSRYLNYSMYHCRVFNVGNTRRRYARDHNLGEQDSGFFDPNDPQATHLRDQWALDTLDELLKYLLEGDGSVAIFDATNTTRERRHTVMDRIRARSSQLKVLFLESICTDRGLVDKNIQLKLFGPDYKGRDPTESLQDFKQRLENYDSVYEPMDDEEGYPYIKMINVGTKLISYQIKGFLASLTLYYLLNFNLRDRQIWITRSAECEDNLTGKIGGNSDITARGDKYARALARFIEDQRCSFDESLARQCVEGEDEFPPSFFVWTSMLRRAEQTAQYFDDTEYPLKQMKMLDEINAGDVDGLTFAEFRKQFPKDYDERQKSKLLYRYPGSGGESYMDVSNRLRSVITEIERLEDNILLVTHHVVARILLGYFMNLSLEVVTNLDVPLHTVYCLEPRAQGVSWSLYEYIEEQDTFVKVPKSELHVTKVKEMCLVHNERHYSLVPTAPSSSMASNETHDSSDSSLTSHEPSSNRTPACGENTDIDELNQRLTKLQS
ncbi:hypothetical protein DAKH74_034180 [Maudiozyma humilis]|uniref:6-phosphofructo-2-kinase domain-containing protein n=1 Tax=Maudiozyma humilis TaxID=51915 RepID=A0AAV5S0F9_MAUHU|nr:hypothetical protein DAKH74_034180 [Kazachstania humilis]